MVSLTTGGLNHCVNFNHLFDLSVSRSPKIVRRDMLRGRSASRRGVGARATSIGGLKKRLYANRFIFRAKQIFQPSDSLS